LVQSNFLMRIPYPERIPYTWGTVFAVALFATQILEHTEFLFALCSFAYVMVAIAAFNLAGGLYRPAGAFIFFNATLTLILALIVKAVLLEPANSNLVAPQRVITVYLLGMVSMLVAVLVDRRFRPRQPLIARYFPIGSLRSMYYGSAILGIAATVFGSINLNIEQGIFSSVLRNLTQLLPLAIILGVLYIVRASNGRKCMTPLVFAIMCYLIVQGLCFYSKQALLTPIFCWAISAGIARYRLKPINIIILGLFSFLTLYVFIPVVQTGKSSEARTEDFLTNGALTIQLLRNFKITRANYQEHTEEEYSKINYFNKTEGLFDRLEMVSVDDLLVDEADRDGYFGYEPTIEAFENQVPKFIWRDKPNPYFGNEYAHQLGILSEDDPTTGVSFSAAADGYKQGGFVGVLIVWPLCLIFVFMAFSWIAGDVRDHPATVLLVLIVGHIGPEGAIPGAISLIDVLIIVVGFSAFCLYVFPVITSAIIPSPDSKPRSLVPITE
jgi:hypothetical protein